MLIIQEDGYGCTNNETYLSPYGVLYGVLYDLNDIFKDYRSFLKRYIKIYIKRDPGNLHQMKFRSATVQFYYHWNVSMPFPWHYK